MKRRLLKGITQGRSTRSERESVEGSELSYTELKQQGKDKGERHYCGIELSIL